ncbi:hypothetical protein AB0H76_03300 [Nocardia sp. NPDC050712]|uniref:TlpA family protein disulfide reductase n=1 Tax=Nocardia sp. NPDC050712 TaxID=3155518 RepID=UPI0033C64042
MSLPWIMVILVLSVLVVAQGLTLIGLITRIEPLLARAEAHLMAPDLTPAQGTSLPEVDLYAADGTVTRPSAWAGHPRLLLFATAFCPSCDQLLDGLRTTSLAPDLPVTLIAGEDSATILRDGTLPTWLDIRHDIDSELADRMGVDRTPLAVLLDEDNRVRSTFVPHAVEDLFRAAEPVAAH